MAACCPTSRFSLVVRRGILTNKLPSNQSRMPQRRVDRPTNACAVGLTNRRPGCQGMGHEFQVRQRGVVKWVAARSPAAGVGAPNATGSTVTTKSASRSCRCMHQWSHPDTSARLEAEPSADQRTGGRPCPAHRAPGVPSHPADRIPTSTSSVHPIGVMTVARHGPTVHVPIILPRQAARPRQGDPMAVSHISIAKSASRVRRGQTKQPMLSWSLG